MQTISRFLISATSSGSGKTTLTLGLLRALKNRGLNTQPFKCGPDYIDTKYHNRASGNMSINLDLFLSSESHVKELYQKYSSNMDVCIIEGVMGLFDGYNRMAGSSANIAETLNIPVVLVINAKSMAYSAGAMLYGFKNFYKSINVVGVIFNFVGSESHYSFLKDACKDVGVEPLGYLPKNKDIEIPSRHLGLTLDEAYQFDEFANKVAEVVEQHIDIDRLLEITKEEVTFPSYKILPTNKSLNIAVAHDEAFNFFYHENIEQLKRLGQVTFFSPLKDKELPEADFIYLPGGYPELYAKELNENKSMREAIHTFIEKDGKVLAECGGMMYLSSSIINVDGEEHPMVDIFKQTANMQNMRLKLGYRTFEYHKMKLKGHEFHYSRLENVDEKNATPTVQYSAKGLETDTRLLRYKNAIASYTHLYWGETNIFDLFHKKTKVI